MKTIVGNLQNATTDPSPGIECWMPEGDSQNIGLIILPGGGYANLAEHEGKGYAAYFSKAGMTCFVVNYRLGTQGFQHPAMLEDSLAAIETIRSRATEFGIDPNRLGIIGSSAGGHLAAHTLVAWDSYQSEVSLRPDFGILCYPVITAHGPYAHEGSLANLMGSAASDALRDSLACDKLVSDQTPPCFLWHTVEDPVVAVENSMLFASALRDREVPFELHIYPHGRHGLGLETSFHWEVDCLRWIKETARSTAAV